MEDGLSVAELREFARTIQPGPAARAVLRSAGFPAEHIPAFTGLNALEFWESVGEALEAGVIVSGRRRLLDAAHARFPANPVFSDGASLSSVLVVGASPQGLQRVRADRELRAVQDAAQVSGLAVHSCPAADVTDLRRILAVRPDILHFACHCETGELIFEYASGREHRVTADAVTETLRTYRDEAGTRLRGVVLGACSGDVIADAFTAVADTVVAHSGALIDDCAVAFADELYRSLRHAGGLGPAARIAARHVADQRHACDRMPTALIVRSQSAVPL